MTERDFSKTDEETSISYYLIINLIDNGESIEKVIDKKVKEGLSFGKAQELVSLAIDFRKSPQFSLEKGREARLMWFKSYIDSPSFLDDLEKKKIGNRELFEKNSIVNSYNLDNNSGSTKHKASSGYEMMIKGLIFLFIGALITGITYLISGPGEKYILCYGGLIVGAIFTFIGFINWISNR